MSQKVWSKMFLAIEEMRQNKLRYGLILGLLILIFYLVFFLTGLAYGLMQENKTAVDKWQADYVLLNSESNRLITASKIDTALLDQVDVGDKALIRQQAGVAYVDKDAATDEKEKVNIFAVDTDSFIVPNIVEGRLYEKTGEVVVDKTMSEVEDFGIGDQIYLSGSDEKVTIVGYTDNAYFGVAPVVYMDFDAFSELMQTDKQQAATSSLASAIVIRGDVSSVPDELEKVAIADFIEYLPGYKAQNITFGFMIGFLVVISAIVIGIFIFVLTTQKSPIFGLMKIQGLSNGYISGSVLAQTFLLAGLGTVVGLAGTYLSSLVLPSAVPFENNWTFYIVIGLALVIFALLGASFSVRSIFKVDPLQNLSQEVVMKTLIFESISKTFQDGSQTITALKPTNFSIEEGEFVAIIGPSGSGKSTFLTLAGGLQTPTTGRVLINQSDYSDLPEKKRAQLRYKDIGFVLQASNLIPFLTVEKQLTLVDKVNKKTDPNKHQKLLADLGVAHLKNKFPKDLSGGERQRVAIARALYNDPALILADEPTASLDSNRSFEVVELLAKEAKERNKSIIMVTHDQRMIEKCDKVYEMKDGVLTQVR